MQKRLCLYFCTLLILGIAVLLVGCGGGEGAPQATQTPVGGEASSAVEPVELDLMASQQGGSWYPIGVALGEILEESIPDVVRSVSIQPGGGTANVVGVQEGKAELAFAHAYSSVDGWNGNPPFKAPTRDIRQIAALHPTYLQVMVRRDSGINSIPQMKGKKIMAGGIKGTTGELLTSLMLQAYGMSYDDLGGVQYLNFADAVEQVKDGHLDGTSILALLPFGTYIDLSTTSDVQLISLDDPQIQTMIKTNPGLAKATIPAGTYRGMDTEVTTVMTPVNLLGHAGLSEDLVYQITKTLAEHLEEMKKVEPGMKELTPQDLGREFGIPLHPGAEKYFKEQGWR